MKPARIFLFTILYVSLTFLYTSCVREDTGDCIQYVLDMQAVDSEGKRPHCNRRLAKKRKSIYFDEKGFIRKIPADISSDLIFGDDKNKRLTLVVWGNIKEDTLIAPDIPIGTPHRRSTSPTQRRYRRKSFAHYRYFLLQKGSEQCNYKKQTGRISNTGYGTYVSKPEYTYQLSDKTLPV